MTSQGSAHGRFTRALAQRNLRGAEIAAKEMGRLSLIDALDYLVLLAEVRPEKAQAAAIRWHGRLELESVTLSLVGSQLALAALADLCAGSTESLGVLKRFSGAFGRRCFRRCHNLTSWSASSLPFRLNSRSLSTS